MIDEHDVAIRRVVLIVGLLNLAYSTALRR
jgi:hypothetical protein